MLFYRLMPIRMAKYFQLALDFSFFQEAFFTQLSCSRVEIMTKAASLNIMLSYFRER